MNRLYFLQLSLKGVALSLLPTSVVKKLLPPTHVRNTMTAIEEDYPYQHRVFRMGFRVSHQMLEDTTHVVDALHYEVDMLAHQMKEEIYKEFNN